ncbi:hypothetical protein DZC30_00765 [Comamonas testosteroni]|uniref:Sialate O-acetylesterase domain-containing protein n=1 Tax=Comamonas testosteroni TaxID=285 RepID=A0A373FS25_COMTE|nr:hypothetical protein DZC30_00765 [Comamonas testosteroni]
MEANLRLIDDHLALYTLAGPVPAATALPTDARQGAGQIFTNGTYAVLNVNIWQTYPARMGMRAIELVNKTEYVNIGSGWQVITQKNEKSYLTLAIMQADTTQPAGSQGVVTNDPGHTAEHPINGIYTWTGATWVRNAFQPANQLDVDGLGVALKETADDLNGVDAKASTAAERMPLRNFGDWPYAIAGDDQVPIIGVKPSGFGKLVTDELPGADLLDPRYRYAVIDQTTGDLLVAYRWDGATINGAARLLDGEYSHVWADEEGNILFARRWDGVLVPGGTRGDVSVYAQGKPGRRSVWAFIDGLPYQLTSTGDAWAPEVASGTVNYLARQAGGVVKGSAALGAKYAPFALRCVHIVASGQSLAVGNNGAATSTRPAAVNRVLAPAFGARKTDTATPILPAEVGPFAPLRSVIGEAPVIEMSNRLALDCMAPADAFTVTSLHASGGKSITELNKGTVYYDNSLQTVTGAKLQCDADGIPYAVGFIDWIQGEKDCKSAAGFYAATLLQLQADYTSDIAAISGQAGQVPILLDQISNWTAYGVATSFVPLEQLQAAIDQPGKFYCAGPKYWLKTNADGVHINSAESIAAGKMHAVAAEKLLAGEPWLPTHCTSAVRNGTQVTLRFHTPLGNLVADTERVSDPGNLGLRWIDSTSSAAITRVVVNADNTVTLTLDQIPSGADPQVGIADLGISGNAGGPTTGARACLRTSVPSTFSDGSEIYHWACHQRINVTTI